MGKSCLVEGCESDYKLARGLCNKHYKRWRTHESLDLKQISVEERFWSKVNKLSGKGACWIWEASRTNKGYGQFRFRGGTWKAHQVAYTLEIGEIPKGLHVDHFKCYNPSCVNPEHLRLVTPKQNNENRSGAQINSSSGINGVYLQTGSGRWRVRISKMHVGYFPPYEVHVATYYARLKRTELYSHNEKDR